MLWHKLCHASSCSCQLCLDRQRCCHLQLNLTGTYRGGSDRTSGVSMQTLLPSSVLQRPSNQGLQTGDWDASYGHPGGTRARGVSPGCMSTWDGARRRQSPVGRYPWGGWQQKCRFPSLPFGYSCQKRLQPSLQNCPGLLLPQCGICLQCVAMVDSNECHREQPPFSTVQENGTSLFTYGYDD